MKTIIKLSILILLFSLSFNINLTGQQQSKTVVAVLEFRVLGRVNAGNDFGKGIQEIVMTNLGQNPSISIVERSRLTAVVKELSYSGSDLFNYKKVVKLGKLLQAKFLVTGSIVGIGAGIRINARIINVKTGRVYKTFRQNSISLNKIFNSLENISSDVESGLMGIDALQISDAPKIEIAFVIDSTGSMFDEIHVVRTKINEILNRTLNANPRPVVKIAVIDYKDYYDEYVTRVFNFTTNLSRLRRHLNSINASGGGDYEESVTEALTKAIKLLKWSKRGASKMIFLIADAPAHRQYLYRVPFIIKNATKKSIGIYTIACSGLNRSGISLFKKISKNTNANFSFLSYRQEYVDRSGRRSEVITHGRKIYKRRIHKPSKATGRPESAARRLNRKSWAKKAAEDRLPAEYKRSREYESRGAGGGAVMSSEKIKIRNMRKTGKMQNNLDEILIKNIRKKASRDLKLKYKENSSEKYAGAVLVKNSGIKTWLFIKSKKSFYKFNKLRSKQLWIFAAIKKSENTFILTNVKIKQGYIPGFAKRNFNKIKTNINYYENNGITRFKRWYFRVTIIKTKKL